MAKKNGKKKTPKPAPKLPKDVKQPDPRDINKDTEESNVDESVPTEDVGKFDDGEDDGEKEEQEL